MHVVLSSFKTSQIALRAYPGCEESFSFRSACKWCAARIDFPGQPGLPVFIDIGGMAMFLAADDCTTRSMQDFTVDARCSR